MFTTLRAQNNIRLKSFPLETCSLRYAPKTTYAYATRHDQQQQTFFPLGTCSLRNAPRPTYAYATRHDQHTFSCPRTIVKKVKHIPNETTLVKHYTMSRFIHVLLYAALLVLFFLTLRCMTTDEIGAGAPLALHYPRDPTRMLQSALTRVQEMSKQISQFIQQDINDKVQDEMMKEIILYSLDHGKKLRPVLIISMYNQNNVHNTKAQRVPDYVVKAALAIEYIHSASLIIDDIQDDDHERRQKSAMHIKYGLSHSQLCAILLCSMSYQNITLSLESLLESQPNTNKYISILLHKIIANKLKELTEGQIRDIKKDFALEQKITGADIQTLIQLIHQKTSSLFELCFILPWMLSHHTVTKEELNTGISEMQDLSRLFGLVYQISDDFEDMKRDSTKMAKSNNLAKNYVAFRGKKQAFTDFQGYVAAFKSKITTMNMFSPELREIVHYLKEKTLLHVRT